MTSTEKKLALVVAGIIVWLIIVGVISGSGKPHSPADPAAADVTPTCEEIAKAVAVNAGHPEFIVRSAKCGTELTAAEWDAYYAAEHSWFSRAMKNGKLTDTPAEARAEARYRAAHTCFSYNDGRGRTFGFVKLPNKQTREGYFGEHYSTDDRGHGASRDMEYYWRPPEKDGGGRRQFEPGACWEEGK